MSYIKSVLCTERLKHGVFFVHYIHPNRMLGDNNDASVNYPTLTKPLTKTIITYLNSSFALMFY